VFNIDEQTFEAREVNTDRLETGRTARRLLMFSTHKVGYPFRTHGEQEISCQRSKSRSRSTPRCRKNTDGKDNAGVVTFHRIDDDLTQVMVQMDFVPEGIVEKLGNAFGVPDRRVKGDLARFKQLIEASGQATDGWRGEVARPDAA
jgi:hypothetical protein